MPHNVCTCKYHSNVSFLLNSISKTNSFFQKKKKKKKNHKELLDYLCCDLSDENCVWGKCSTCLSRKITDLTVDLELEAELTWKQWTDDQGGIQLIIARGNMAEAIKELDKKIPHFKIHCHTSIPFVDTLKIFSDNCTDQFKSRYIISIMCKMEEKLGLGLEWNFFASSHGKGAVDGVSATVKRHTRQRSLRMKPYKTEEFENETIQDRGVRE
ncbi:hypothetical protein PR048_031894 [Dryococelus australis]|uniref:Uncharacterized protein n=1 Tax=Dryococelus australis TaxID=614101 RepID=A0ABQ9G6K3_9NEOP|nr:hypothetical protein PR048_031894 [Dryococelus australis]